MANLEETKKLSDAEATAVSGGYSGPLFVYTIKPGDCLSVLAQKYGTTVATLCEINGITNPNLIYAGHKLYIPYKG